MGDLVEFHRGGEWPELFITEGIWHLVLLKCRHDVESVWVSWIAWRQTNEAELCSSSSDVATDKRATVSKGKGDFSCFGSSSDEFPSLCLFSFTGLIVSKDRLCISQRW